MELKDIEDTLITTAMSLGTSTAKLRALYTRGVNECLEQGYDGAPSAYGLARVQRFAMASRTGNYRLSPDSDFAPHTINDSDPVSYEINADEFSGWALIYDMMSADGIRVAEEFPPGSVDQTIYDTDTKVLSVLGTHNEVQWFCTLNLATGESDFSTSTD